MIETTKPDDALAAVAAEVARGAGDRDATGAFPHAAIAAVHGAGLLTGTIGTEYGGGGDGLVRTSRVLQTLGGADPSVALIVSMTLLVHAAERTAHCWPSGPYGDLVAASHRRPLLLNVLRAEPRLGSPTRSGLPATTARRTADGWVLHGRKTYATGAEGLAWHLVYAVTDESPQRVGTFIVPGDDPAVRVIRTWDHLGLRASGSHDAVYEGVEIPREHHLDLATADDGPPVIPHDPWDLAFHALYLGVARAAQEFLHRHARERITRPGGRPIAETDRIRTAAGEIELQLASAESFLYGVAERIDRGDHAAHAEVQLAKVAVNRAATTAVEIAVRTLGNAALTRRHPLERHFRDVQCSHVHAPQEDLILVEAGRRVLGGDAR